jgi:hypothetical protein
MRSRACLWARCGQRGKGGREGGERGGSKEKAFALLSRCGGKKRGKSVDERHALDPSLGLIFSLGDQHLTVCSIF